MATTNIQTQSGTREWVQACGENENCEIETLDGNISFIESQNQPINGKESNNMVFLKEIPRSFNGNGIDKLWIFIDKNDRVRKRPKTQNTNTKITGIEVASGILDAFGRLRVSDPKTLFDAQLQYDVQPFLWQTKITGTATEVHDPLNSAVDLNVFADDDKIERQQIEYNLYQPGKSQFVLMTYTPDENVINPSVEFALRSSSGALENDSRFDPIKKEIVITQDTWNVDKLDGTGPSEIALDLKTSQIFFVDLEWLSVGTVSFGFFQNKLPVYCHFEHNANKIRGAYMTTANLPLKYLIEREDTQIIKEVGYYDYNNGAFVRYRGEGTNGTLKEICTAVISEGGQDIVSGFETSISSGATPITLTSGSAVRIGVRHSLLFNNIENRARFEPQSFKITSSEESIYYRLVYKPTITGGTWAQHIDGDFKSIMELNSTITSIANGVTIDSGHVLASSQGNSQVSGDLVNPISSKFPFGLDIDGANPIALVLEIVNTGVGSTDITYDLSKKEIR